MNITNTSESTTPRILVVDDSKSVRHALNKHLTAAGFDVVQAEDGQEGYDLGSQGGYDLIITDIDMPHMDGIELCERLKSDFATSRTPIIVLAANDDDALVEEGFRVGVDAYFAKGDDIEENVHAIIEFLRHKRLMTGSRILVVDDSQSVRSFLVSGLVGEGFTVDMAVNGEEALAKLGSFKPDLIVSDMMMPEMDGAELCNAVKQSEEYGHTPMVMMSTIGDKSLMRNLMRKGASSYLIKPFTINQLLVVIEEVFSNAFRKMEPASTGELDFAFNAIVGLVHAYEARQAHTTGQSERVALFAKGIAEEMGLSESEIDRIMLGGRLHDVGMISVRDAILFKKEPLTKDEFEQIKCHVGLARDILGPIKSLEDVLPAATQHHERWDGSGYPEGLTGEDIPLMARIIAVADVYEALTSERPYRDSLPAFVAMDILKEDRGTKFCPECIDAFLKWFDKTSGEVDLPEEFLVD